MNGDIFTEYVRKYRNTVFRVAYSFVNNVQDSEDITQDALLKLYKSEEKFSSDENVKAWLIRVTSNAAKNHLSSVWVKRKTQLPDNIILKEEKDYELLDAVNRLNVNYRTVIYLHYYEGYTAPEMAELAMAAGLNIDYYPTNFIMQDGLLYYIDYECNPYDEQWSFERWGAQYWSVAVEKA